MKLRNYQSVFFVLVLSLFLSSMTVGTDSRNLAILMTDISHPSSVLWFDDFENETMTLDQWIFEGYNPTYGWGCPANVSVSNGMLYSTGPIINYLFHNSTTTTGTWSLDVFLDYDFDYTLISFTSNYYNEPGTIGGRLGYVISLYTSGAKIHVELGYWVPDPAGSIHDEIDTYSFNRTSGWIHIDITRQPDKYLYAYLNGTLILQGKDSRWSTSEYFAVETYADSYFIFDNITVSDSIDIDKASPHWIEPLVDQEIAGGDDFHYSLHAYDYAGLDSWWIGDSTHFAIDQEGNLTSIGLLPIGYYKVEVFVNDTNGNVLSGTFNLDVGGVGPSTTTGTSTSTTTTGTSTSTTTGTSTSTTTGTPDALAYMVLVISVGSSVVIIVVVLRIIWFKKP